MPLIPTRCQAGKQVGHPEEDTQGHLVLGWESVRAARQGSALVCIWLINLLGMAKMQTEVALEIWPHILLNFICLTKPFRWAVKPRSWQWATPDSLFQETRQCILEGWTHRVCSAVAPHFSWPRACSQLLLMEGSTPWAAVCDPQLDQGTRSGCAQVHSLILPNKHWVFVAPRLVVRRGTDWKCSAVRYRSLQRP